MEADCQRRFASLGVCWINDGWQNITLDYDFPPPPPREDVTLSYLPCLNLSCKNMLMWNGKYGHCEVVQSHSRSPRRRTMGSKHWKTLLMLLVCCQFTIVSSSNTVLTCLIVTIFTSSWWQPQQITTTAKRYCFFFFKSLYTCQVIQWCIYILKSLLESFEIENKAPPSASPPPAVPKDPLLLRIY